MLQAANKKIRVDHVLMKLKGLILWQGVSHRMRIFYHNQKTNPQKLSLLRGPRPIYPF